MEDVNKVRAIIDHLNSLEGPGKGKWLAAAGFHAMVAMEIQNNRMSQIPDSAVGLKLFFNTETGEIRTYSSRFF